MINLNLNNENGRSMIEMLGVLAIIGVLSVGGIAGYSKAMQNYRINKTIEQITLIAGNIRAFFAPQKNYIGVKCDGSGHKYDGICDATNGCEGADGSFVHGVPSSSNNGCPIIKKAKILPDEMISITNNKINSIINPFGYGVILDTESRNKDNDNQAFSIVYGIGNNVDVCIELLSHDWSEAKNIVISIYDDAQNYCFKPLSISLDKVAEKCAEAIETHSDNVALRFYFDIDPNGEVWKDANWVD